MTDYNKMERKEASRDGATLVKNSGRGQEKGDAKLDNFLVDYKFNAKSFTIGIKNWIELRKQAWGSQQREPLIVVKFGDGTTVAIVEWEMFEQMREDYNKAQKTNAFPFEFGGPIGRGQDRGEWV
jgi:hypothetical protein